MAEQERDEQGRFAGDGGGLKTWAEKKVSNSSQKVSKASQKVVEALARYIDAKDADIKTQQRMYNAYRKALDQLESKFPNYNFRSQESTESLERAARKHLSSRAARGPGAGW